LFVCSNNLKINEKDWHHATKPYRTACPGMSCSAVQLRQFQLLLLLLLLLLLVVYYKIHITNRHHRYETFLAGHSLSRQMLFP
jgi:hypothetical protein